MPASHTSTPQLPRYIALTGLKGSGKDYLGQYLEELGYLHIPASSVLRNLAYAQGFKEPIARDILSRIGDDLKRVHGLHPIANSSIDRYLSSQNTHMGLVISGLRRPGEIDAFKKHGALVLWIDADSKLRFNNIQERNRGDALSYEEFMTHDKQEYNGDNDGRSINLHAIKSMADITIINDNSERFLMEALKALESRS